MQTTLPLRVRRWWRTQLRPFILLVLAVFAFRSAVADWYKVPSGSMKPTILEGDGVLVNKLAYELKVPFTTWHVMEWGQPQRGDVVVCYSPADGIRLVKRVVGVPGDRIELRHNRLFINGQPATYSPLSAEQAAAIPAEQQSAHRFAFETVEAKGHPVMWTPGLLSRDETAPFTGPEGRFFLMGDNRDNSFDSRYFGTVARDQIFGRAVAVAWSFDPAHSFRPRSGRMGTPLP